MDLNELRKEIDEIDTQLVTLYEKRMKISEEVAKYKINTGKPVFDKERENAKLDWVKSQVHSEFTKHGIEELFLQIMSMSRKLQYQLLNKNGIQDKTSFRLIDTIENKKDKFVAIMLSDVELMFPIGSKEFKYVRKVILDGMNDYTRSYLRILFGDVEGLVMK